MTVAQTAHSSERPSDATEALSEGTLLLGDQFTILKRLGNGGFGITYLANDNYLDRNVVIKECFPEVFCRRAGSTVQVRSKSNFEKYRSIVDMFTREARSIAKLRHPNIIGVHRVFEDNETAYIALDLIDGQDLLQIIQEERRKFSPQHIKKILIKLLDAVQMVHEQDLLHRDISPDNILLDKWGSPVLIDFGAAREEASRETRALSAVLVVKDGYSPQEFYFAGGKQTASSDLYALAATFYHLISGSAPPNSQVRMADVAAGNPDPCEPLEGRFDGYDSTFLRAIDKAMSVLPKDRLQSAKEWRERIDSANRAPEAYVLPPIDQTLEKTLTRLVSETNDQLMKLPEPASQEKPAPNRETRLKVPDWIREFNEETIERKKKGSHPKASAYAGGAYAHQQADYDVTNTSRISQSTKTALRASGYLMVMAMIVFVGYVTVIAG